MNWTAAQKRILLVAWLGWVFDIMDTAIFNFAKAPMLTQMLGGTEQYVKLGPAIEGRIQSIFLLGWAIGGLIFGIMADRWGRMRTLTLTVLIYSVFTGLTALCKTPDQVAFLRFLTGMGIGGEWAAGAALIAEAFRFAKRGPASAILQSAAAFGPALAALASYALKNDPWQWMFIVGVFPALVTVGLRYLARDAEGPTAAPAQDAGSPIALLKDVRYRKNVIVATIVGAVGIIGAMTATFWMPNLVMAALKGSDPGIIQSKTAVLTWISHIGTLLGVILVPNLAERVGRRPVIAAFFICAPLVVVLGIGPTPTYERLLAMSPVLNFFAIGVSAAFVLAFPEMFPQRFRALGSGIAYNTGRLLAIPMPMVTGYIATSGSPITTAVAISGGIYVIGLIALCFWPETMGKGLPEDDVPSAVPGEPAYD